MIFSKLYPPTKKFLLSDIILPHFQLLIARSNLKANSALISKAALDVRDSKDGIMF